MRHVDLPEDVRRRLSPEAPPARRLEFHVVYRCVNACLFCSERDHMARFARHPAAVEEAVRILERKRSQGFEHVTFTGGEPTLHPGLPAMLESAKRLGFRTFLISNGSALSLPAFARRVLPLVDELCLSLHGDGPDLHDRLTGNPRSFERLVRALANADAADGAPFVMVNTVVTRLNLRRLAGVLRLAARFRKPRHWLLSNMAPEGEGLRRLSELAVRHEELSGELTALAQLASSLGVVLRVFGVPACALGPHWRLSNDLYFDPRATVARTFVGGRPGWFEELAARPTRERRQGAACGDCALRRACGGVFAEHARALGWPELRPFAEAETSPC